MNVEMWNILWGVSQTIPETQIKDYPEIIKRKSTNIEMNWNDGNEFCMGDPAQVNELEKQETIIFIFQW